jgi:hypothetical protein
VSIQFSFVPDRSYPGTTDTIIRFLFFSGQFVNQSPEMIPPLLVVVVEIKTRTSWRKQDHIARDGGV